MTDDRDYSGWYWLFLIVLSFGGELVSWGLEHPVPVMMVMGVVGLLALFVFVLNRLRANARQRAARERWQERRRIRSRWEELQDRVSDTRRWDEIAGERAAEDRRLRDAEQRLREDRRRARQRRVPGFVELRVHDSSRRCPYCHDGLADQSDHATCIGCQAVYHQDCIQELGACATLGCRNARWREVVA